MLLSQALAGLGFDKFAIRNSPRPPSLYLDKHTRRILSHLYDDTACVRGLHKEQWSAAGFRDTKFKEATQNVARFLATIDADISALTEVGSEDDVRELAQELQQLGASYPNMAVCKCTDSVTRQHVAVLSKLPIGDTLGAVVGREGYDTELDDPETERHTGLSKAIRVQFSAEGHTFHLYVVHLLALIDIPQPLQY